MEPNPLDQLEQRIKTEPEKVKQADVDLACQEEEKSVNKLYDELGEKPDSPIRKAHQDRLAAFKAKLTKEISDLRQPYAAGRLRFFEESKKMRKEIGERAEALKKRMDVREQSKKVARDSTDPANPNRAVPDFEGRDTKDNTVRLLLTGYVRGLGVDNSGEAIAALAKARELHDNSAKGWRNGKILNWDSMFTAEHLLEDMGLKPYIADLEKYGFSSETIGYFAALLKNAEGLSAADRQSYRQYLFGKLDELKAGRKLDFKGSKDDNLNKGDFELGVLNDVKTPKEWVEGLKGMRDLFTKLKDAANQLSSALGFTYSDGTVRDFLAKNVDQISEQEFKESISFANSVNAIRKEAYTYFLAAINAADTGIKDAGTKLTSIEADNKKKKKIQDKDIADLRAMLSGAGDDLKKITLGPTDTLEQLAEQLDYLKSAKDTTMAAQSKMAEMEKTLAEPPPTKGGGSGGAGGAGGETPSKGGDKVDPYKDKWEDAVEVDYIWKAKYLRVSPNVTDAVYRDKDGKVLGKIPALTELTVVDVNAKCKKVNDNVFIEVYYNEKGGRGPGKKVWVELGMLQKSDKSGVETVESAEVATFRKEKNLALRKETIDAKEHHLYFVDLQKSPTRRGADGKPEKIFGNEDVHRIIGEKITKFANSVMDAEAKKFVQSLRARIDLNDFQKMGEAFEYLTYRFKEKLVPDWEKKMDNFKPDFEALQKTFIMDFDHQPSLSELQGKYAEFLRALEKVSTDLDQLLVKDWEKPAPKRTVELPDRLGFLGPIYLEYSEAFKAMDRFGSNPERYPEGVTFDLKVNNVMSPCRVKYENGKCMFIFPGGIYVYNKLDDLMADLNSGDLHRKLNERILLLKDNFKPWESAVGDIEKTESRPDLGFGTIQMEFDWDNPNPIINVQVLPHGKIAYAIRRENVGLRGEDLRRGNADNFYDFMLQLKEIKTWAEGPKHEFAETTDVRRQALFSEITDPFSYRNRQAEIGRVVASRLGNNGVQEVYLDWGGGNSPYDKRNAALNVWVDEAGGLKFILKGHSIGGDGRVVAGGKGVGPEGATDFNSIIARVKAIRERAGVTFDAAGLAVA